MCFVFEAFRFPSRREETRIGKCWEIIKVKESAIQGKNGSNINKNRLSMPEKASSYVYRHAGFILGKGYFNKENIQYMASVAMIL